MEWIERKTRNSHRIYRIGVDLEWAIKDGTKGKASTHRYKKDSLKPSNSGFSGSLACLRADQTRRLQTDEMCGERIDSIERKRRRRYCGEP